MAKMIINSCQKMRPCAGEVMLSFLTKLGNKVIS